MSNFVHLRAHSQYSVLDATASPEDLVEKAVQEGFTALALTDHGNLFGVVEFYKACKEAKIKAVIGCELYVAPRSRFEKTKIPGMRPAYSLTLLAKNQQGYRNLCKLSSTGYLDGFYYHPRIDDDLLQKHSEGLICITGSLGTRLAHEILQGSPESASSHIELYRNLFGDDLYFDLQRHEMDQQLIDLDELQQETWVLQQYRDFIQRQQQVNQTLLRFSSESGISCIATNDIHYIRQTDWRPHEILLNIQSGEPCELWEKDSYGNPKFRIPNPKRATYPSHAYHFKSAEEMERQFSDFPEALALTAKISEQCHVEIDFKTKHYPVYLPPGLESTSYTKEEQSAAVESFLWKLCEEGIARRYTSEKIAKVQEIFPDREPMQIIRERLDYEMSIIVPKGMADYLLIVWDFINWAKRSGIPMGPGRGSGAGSIVLYLIGVTDIEPLRFHLFFERFINPERISYPDIDVDICMDRRGDVIAYTLQKYGKENVAQIITFGTMKAKMALKDVGRVLSVPLSKVNAIAKLVPDDLNITLDKALEKDHDLRSLYESDAEVGRLIDIARKLEGSIRNTGIHAAGIIISGVPLVDLIPICNAKDSEMPVTQFSMKPVEAVGMLKVDFLGLTTLTAIQKCVEAVHANMGKAIDWIDLPLDDKPTFDLLNQGKTLGIFQLESGGMQDLARQLHLDRFEEIIAVGALYRPGPMDMIPSFINRKHGKEPIEYDHPWMNDILSETYGIMVYQEQVMQIASKLANFTLGEGDVLRRAMGKKDMDQMATQREKFKFGAKENSIDEKTSMMIFDKMEKFAAYGFNKSHAAAYGYLSYVTAYLKANHPGEWMAALMTCARDDISKIAKFIGESQSMGIAVLPPDVNEAGDAFQATNQGIRFAMTGIKGIGAGVVEAIIKERNSKGPFKSLYEFIKRIDTRKIGKKAIEGLVEAGAFDFTNWTRDALIMSIDAMYEAVSKDQKEQAQGIMSLFSLAGDYHESRFNKPPQVAIPTSRQEILRKEKSLLGFFLTGHPMDEYKHILQRLSCQPLGAVEQMDHDAVFRAAFIVESIQTRVSSKSQKKFAILMISDGIERMELPIWPELYEEKHLLLNENQLLYAVLQVDKKEGDLRLSCRWLGDLTKADEEMIQECDRVFDQAKFHVKRIAQAKQHASKNPAKAAQVKTTPLKEELMATLAIKLDADRTRLSHILQLKKLFSEYAGKRPIQIDFNVSEKSAATLFIEEKWGVDISDEVKQKIQSLDCTIAVEEIF
jgi:DNA polymerase-3 subunit alpha